jgi:hypothetical protein
MNCMDFQTQTAAPNANLGNIEGVARLRVILQDRQTHLYFCGEDGWTAKIDRALDFKRTALAIQFVHTARMANLDLVLNFGDPKGDIRLAAS